MQNIKAIKIKGYSLIELIIFIMVMAIGIGALIALSFSLRTTHNTDSQTQALGLAKERMEIIYANRMQNGYATASDPCASASPPAICVASPTGFVVSSTIVAGDLLSSGWVDNVAGVFKKVTVNVTGNANASLNLLLTNY